MLTFFTVAHGVSCRALSKLGLLEVYEHVVDVYQMLETFFTHDS